MIIAYDLRLYKNDVDVFTVICVDDQAEYDRVKEYCQSQNLDWSTYGKEDYGDMFIRNPSDREKMLIKLTFE